MWSAHRPVRSVLAAILLLGGLQSCTGAEGGQGPDAVTIRLHHSRFEPAQITVGRGARVRIILVNDDPIDHEWIVGDEDSHRRHRTGTEPVHDTRPTEVSVPASETRVTDVVFERAGTVRFVCHLPGHEQYGMVGRLVIG